MENEKLNIIKNWCYSIDIDNGQFLTEITVRSQEWVFQCSDITLELCIDKMYQDISNQIYDSIKHLESDS